MNVHFTSGLCADRAQRMNARATGTKPAYAGSLIILLTFISMPLPPRSARSDSGPGPAARSSSSASSAVQVSQRCAPRRQRGGATQM
jgi:hypothetical protein